MSIKSLRGLARAVDSDEQQVQPFDPSTDPLGVALKARAQQQRFTAMANGTAPRQGPLPDPNWDAYFLAVQDAAGGRPVDFAGSAGRDLGYDTNNGTMGAGTEVYGPRGMTFNRRQRGFV